MWLAQSFTSRNLWTSERNKEENTFCAVSAILEVRELIEWTSNSVLIGSGGLSGVKVVLEEKSVDSVDI